MSQFDLGNIESPISGSDFFNNKLEPWRNALHSGHSGSVRPDYVVEGMRWIDNTDADLWELKLFTGSTDIIEAYADTVNNVIIPSSAGSADLVSYDNVASGLTGDNAQEAIDELAAFKDRGVGFATSTQGATADTALQPGDATKLTLTSNVTATGSAVDFTGIPANTKRITVLLRDISLTGASNILIQLGTSSGVDAAATYNSASSRTAGTSITNAGGSTENGFIAQNNSSTNSLSGAVILSLVDATANSWVASGTITTAGQTITCTGGKSLSGVLTSVRLTNVGAANTFDAGNVSISYEV